MLLEYGIIHLASSPTQTDRGEDMVEFLAQGTNGDSIGFGLGTVVLLIIANVIVVWPRLKDGEDLSLGRSVTAGLLTMSIVGMIATIASINQINSFAETIAQWVARGESSVSLVPIICLIVSLGIRAAQIFQGVTGPVKWVLDKIPNPIEWGVMALATLVGGVSMAGSEIWREWILGATNIVQAVGTTLGAFIITTVEILIGAIFG